MIQTTRFCILADENLWLLATIGDHAIVFLLATTRLRREDSGVLLRGFLFPAALFLRSDPQDRADLRPAPS